MLPGLIHSAAVCRRAPWRVPPQLEGRPSVSALIMPAFRHTSAALKQGIALCTLFFMHVAVTRKRNTTLFENPSLRNISEKNS